MNTRSLSIQIFRILNLVIIFVMTFSLPLSGLAQDPAPFLAGDKTEYTPGEVANITGAGFAAGDYVLVAKEANGEPVNWVAVFADEFGAFAAASPVLAEGAYEVRAYVFGWSGDWGAAPLASLSFSVVAPTPPEPPPPTLQSDKADYAPGALVTLSGANWKPGEVVAMDGGLDERGNNTTAG